MSSGRGSGRLHPERLGARHEHTEHGPASELGAHLDLVGQQPRQTIADREPQTQALAIGAMQPHVFFEDGFALLDRNADAGVPDFDAQCAVRTAAPDEHFAAVRVDDGVLREVEHDAIEQHRIAHHPAARTHDFEFQAFACGEIAHLERDTIEHLGYGKRADARLYDTRVELGYVENLAQRIGDRGGRFADLRDQLPLIGMQVRGLQTFDEHGQRLHRLAQIVARGGEEARFGQIGALGLLLAQREAMQRRLILLVQAQVLAHQSVLLPHRVGEQRCVQQPGHHELQLSGSWTVSNP